jgi:hypothetical protein
VEQVYAWLRRHPWLVDGTLAVVLVLPRYAAARLARIVVPGGDAGHGLAGMRERAATYGGTVQAGTRPGGGFEVSARLPVPPAVPAAPAATASPAWPN